MILYADDLFRVSSSVPQVQPLMFAILLLLLNVIPAD